MLRLFLEGRCYLSELLHFTSRFFTDFRRVILFRNKTKYSLMGTKGLRRKDLVANSASRNGITSILTDARLIDVNIYRLEG